MGATKYKLTLVQVVFALALSLMSICDNFAWAGKQPKLLLQITVDGLRGDLPSRFPNVLGEGRFRYLMK